MRELRRKFFHLLWTLVLIYVPLYIISALKSARPSAQELVATPAPDLYPASEPLPPHTTGPLSGEMRILTRNLPYTAKVPDTLNKPTYRLRGNSARMHMIGERPVTLMEYGRDLNAYFANGFFKGFVPFPVESQWLAMHHVSKRLQYVLDSEQFGGYQEIWLTSEEAYENMRGDCEDHAILLADWLSALGYDARVAFGSFKNEGHAWVVLFDGGKTYLLEATSKYVKRSFPLAAALPQYHPEGMFNRDFIWYNYGSKLTTDYGGRNWVKTARFLPYGR